MRTASGWIAVVAALAGASPAMPQEGTARFAVLPLENTGSYGQDKEVFEALELGLAGMLARAIDRHPAAEVVPRTQLPDAMRALAPGSGQRVDAAGAARVGKETGARYTVAGSFADFYGKFRINARVVDVRSGAIVKVVSNDDPELQDRDRLAAIIHHVAQKITAATGLPPYPSGAAAQPIPTEAITTYSRALLHESRGDRAKAADLYRSAIESAPGFEEASDGLARVRGP
jgi:TolB-like protein